ncbi:MAG TPA: hypothetical protein VJL89_05110 [Thermodesulfovibrionia bacterium]|nr:hypothetical protein [Thermodesulfovibrionia bacterium]
MKEIILFFSKKEHLQEEKIVDRIQTEFPELKITRYNLEDAPEEGKKYGVQDTPSVVINAQDGCSLYSFPVSLKVADMSELPLVSNIPDFDFCEMEEKPRCIPYESFPVERIRFLLKIEELERDIKKLTKEARISRLHQIIILALLIFGILWLIWLGR